MTQETSTTKLEVILGRQGVAALRDATVMVYGLGGVGSNCVEALARGGVGHLVLIDRDEVQTSNINRQAIAFHSTIGQRKVDATRAMVADINPNAVVTTYDTFVLPENLHETLDAHPEVDFIVDAIDTVATKLALAEIADREGLPLISSMGAANKLDPTALRFADIHKTVNCRLSRIIRKEARLRGIKHLQVLYSCEHAPKIPSKPGAARSERSNLGTMSYMPPIMGQMLAAYVIRAITGLDASADEA